MKKSVLYISIGILSCMIASITVQAQETVKIGGIFSISGAAAAFGVPQRDVTDVLVKRINAEGGIKGKKLEIIYCDDQTNPTESARCVSKLIRQDKAVAILGSTIGTGTLAMMPVAARAETPVIAPVGTISVTDKTQTFWPWFFRSSMNDSLVIDATMERGVFAQNLKRVAVLYKEDAFGDSGMKHIRKLSMERDFSIVASVAAPMNAMDLSAAATNIRSSKPDVVIIQASSPALGAAFARAAKQAGIEAPLLASTALNQRSFIEASGPAAEDVQLVSMSNWFQPSAKQKPLVDALKAVNKEPTGFAEIVASTGVLALAEAIRRVDGEITGPKIRDALETICDFDGTYLFGKLCYSRDQHEGLATDSLVRLRIKNGAFVTLD